MKKTIILALVIVLIGVFFCACSNEDETEGVSYINDNNKTFTLNADDYTIYDGRFTYITMIGEYENGKKYIFLYPNSSTWSVEIKNGGDINTGRVEYSEDYGEPRYATGEELYEAYTALMPMVEDKDGLFNIEFTAPKVIFTVLFLGIGIFMIAAPYTIWRVFEGWKFEEKVEPSDAYIGVVVAAGVVSIIVALVVFLFV